MRINNKPKFNANAGGLLIMETKDLSIGVIDLSELLEIYLDPLGNEHFRKKKKKLQL